MADSRSFNRILRNMRHIRDQADAITSNTSLSEIRTCLSLLKDEWNCFQSVEKTYKGKFDENNQSLIEEIEENHFKLKQVLVKWEKTYEEKNVDPIPNTMDDLIRNQQGFLKEFATLGRREAEVRLPRMNMPTFDGKYSEFPSFRDIFETSVHRNTNIAKIHKFQYLKSLLRGEASTLINHISITEANYDEAWDKITSRYDKRKHAVHSLLKQFMEQPKLTGKCAKSLRKIHDTSDEVIRGLKVLGEEAQSRDPWLIYMLLNKLDLDSKEAWADETAETDFPTLAQFFKFLNKRSDMLEALISMPSVKINTQRRSVSMVTKADNIICPLCSANHYLGRCENYVSLSVPERTELVATKKLCFNCLAPTHQAVVCRSRYSCKICKRRHHLTLHLEDERHKDERCKHVDNKPNDQDLKNFNVTMESKVARETQAILPTVAVIVRDRYGGEHRCRALLDSGSQSSFISESCVKRLSLQRHKANLSITGITANSTRTKGKSIVVMTSIHDSKMQIEINALILNKLPSNIPEYNINRVEMPIIDKLQLADPDYYRTAPIDLLIGADKFFAILKDGRKQLNSMHLQETIFGWVLSGIPTTSMISMTCTSIQSESFHDIDETLRRFWEMEEATQINTIGPDDQQCELFYNTTVRRQENGRYVVKIPFKQPATMLGDSLAVATRRYLSGERRLAADKHLKQSYTEQMKEYILMGHMVEITFNHNKGEAAENVYYLPHHPVFKGESETTKMRVVFDGSSKTTTGVSLNDIVMVGPTIQPTLWSILIKFRCHRVALTADVEKMYRQVIVAPEDTDYQRVLWRESSDEKIRHFK